MERTLAKAAHQTTDLGVRGSTPLGRANLFNRLEAKLKAFRGERVVRGPLADLAASNAAERASRPVEIAHSASPSGPHGLGGAVEPV